MKDLKNVLVVGKQKISAAEVVGKDQLNFFNYPKLIGVYRCRV